MVESWNERSIKKENNASKKRAKEKIAERQRDYTCVYIVYPDRREGKQKSRKSHIEGYSASIEWENSEWDRE